MMKIEAYKFDLRFLGVPLFEGMLTVGKHPKKKNTKIVGMTVVLSKELLQELGIKVRIPLGIVKEVPEDEDIFSEDFLMRTIITEIGPLAKALAEQVEEEEEEVKH